MIVFALCLFPVVGLALFVTSANLREVLTAEEQDAVAPVEEGRTAAVMAVEDWLRTDPPPIPGGGVVAWESAEALSAHDTDQVAEELGDLGEARLIVHRIVVRSDVGVLAALVLVASSPDGSQTIIGQVGLEPVAPTLQNLAATDAWRGLEPVEPGDSAQAAVAAWVDAFTSGDPDRLRLVVGDPASGHHYLPMEGVAAATHDVHAAAAPSAGTEDGQLVVQVDVTLEWDAQDEDATEDTAAEAQVSYDVLVADPDSAAPRVVAWGAPGSGTGLTPYQNAVDHEPPDATDEAAREGA
ncbi:hypothetical protein ACFT2C_06245 [Promicromonospora sp. NPDC057138]|uniref:hypothetical protein n=1 Tax=Promicromonospora sp. NPDC057138 TaxID=3346031 RepID=UPI00363222A9